MRIDYERTGGFAGMRLAVTLDTAVLPPDQANVLHSLITEANFFALPAQIPAPSHVADQFHYLVTIKTEGKRHTVDVDEGAASPALQTLLQQLTLLARFARGA